MYTFTNGIFGNKSSILSLRKTCCSKKMSSQCRLEEIAKSFPQKEGYLMLNKICQSQLFIRTIFVCTYDQSSKNTKKTLGTELIYS